MAWDDRLTSDRFGEILGMGGSCFASVVDAATVHKSYEIWVNGKWQSRHIKPWFYGVDEIRPGIHALRLERSRLGSVRDAIVTAKREEDGTITFTPKPGPPLRTRLRMGLDIALAVQHAHAKAVRHCDLTCRNFLLFDDSSFGDCESGDAPYEYRVKVADWGGAVIDGHATGTGHTWEEMRYELPCRGRALDARPVLPRQIFALGSAVYEVLMWRRPFTGKTDDEVEKLYAREEFDSLEGLPETVAAAIQKCWAETAPDVDEMVRVLEEELSKANGLNNCQESKAEK